MSTNQHSESSLPVPARHVFVSARMEHSHGYITPDDVDSSGSPPGPRALYSETYHFSQPTYVTQRMCSDALYLSRELSFSYIELSYPLQLEAHSLRSYQTCDMTLKRTLFSNLHTYTSLGLASYRRGQGPSFPQFGESFDPSKDNPSRLRFRTSDAMLFFYGLQEPSLLGGFVL